MKSLLIPCLCCAALLPGLAEEPRPQPRVTLSIREADLRDVLRAAAEGTDLNLTFDPSLDTRVQGVELKNMTLQEILDEVLPNFGFGVVRTGRTLHIVKSDGGLKFYNVDFLALRRSGKKEFSVNASGQLINAAGMGGASGAGAGAGAGSGASSAYTSSLQTANGGDAWEELQSGLSLIVFGSAPARSGALEAQAPPSPVSLSQGGRSLMIQPDSGLVAVAADAPTQARVGAYLEEIRRRHARQIVLEAKIVEVTLGNDSQIGVDWNALLSKGAASGGQGTNVSGTFTPGTIINPNVGQGMGVAQLVVQNASLTAALSALAREDRLQVLSAPRLSTLNNQKAILRVVREEAYFFQTSQTTGTGGVGGFSTTVNITPMVVPVGIVLDIQPQIGDDGSITLAVNPSVSQIVTVNSLNIPASGISGGAQATLPVVDRRDLDTVVRMHSGETLVLAGIMKANSGLTDRGVPWLRKIPLLGNLFSQRENTRSHTELAIFITPTLSEDAAQIRDLREQSEKRLVKAGGTLEPEPEGKSGLKVP